MQRTHPCFMQQEQVQQEVQEQEQQGVQGRQRTQGLQPGH